MEAKAKVIHCPKCPECQEKLTIVKVENGETMGLCPKGHGLFDFRHGQIIKAATA